MSRPKFLSAFFEFYEGIINDNDNDGKMILLIHWCFLNKRFYVMDGEKVKMFFKMIKLIVFFL